MELTAAIRGRRSIRKFEPRNVPKEVITDILETARWSPSWGNTQPWSLYVLTGKTLQKFKEMNLLQSMTGAPVASDVPMLERWPDAMKARYGQLGKVVLSAQGIARDDKAGRERYYAGMVTAFDAPCLILACISRDNLVEYQMLDIGLIAQSVCLAAHDKGLGTCLLASTARFPAEIRKIAAIPDDKKIVVGIAMGYPDTSFALNQFQRERANLDEFVFWLD
ncbi:MAG: nitroreductase family protein [Smithellaceae bacterium]|jgi:nitroreductase|nr:nitroreductase family protein [Smithellaceae bacterium]MDD3258095.1 nitroreductase family protein [Smithellaceae bacterium]MDD3849826.1 nitroreductase family protein [Smithellaceae bacterium]HOQ72229.1 nitroreductase family protein [Smithellaceae bacterium]